MAAAAPPRKGALTSPLGDGCAGRGAYPGRVDEQAAGRELEAAIGEALWRYAEAVTGLGRDAAGEQGPRLAGRQKPLARLAGARRARQALADAETAAAAAAIECGATSPMLARAAAMARQTVWKRYRPR